MLVERYLLEGEEQPRQPRRLFQRDLGNNRVNTEAMLSPHDYILPALSPPTKGY